MDHGCPRLFWKPQVTQELGVAGSQGVSDLASPFPVAQSRCRQNSSVLPCPCQPGADKPGSLSALVSLVRFFPSSLSTYSVHLDLIFLHLSSLSSPAACTLFLRCCALVNPFFRSFPPYFSPFPYIAANYYATIWMREGSRPQFPPA